MDLHSWNELQATCSRTEKVRGREDEYTRWCCRHAINHWDNHRCLRRFRRWWLSVSFQNHQSLQNVQSASSDTSAQSSSADASHCRCHIEVILAVLLHHVPSLHLRVHLRTAWHAVLRWIVQLGRWGATKRQLRHLLDRVRDSLPGPYDGELVT